MKGKIWSDEKYPKLLNLHYYSTSYFIDAIHRHYSHFVTTAFCYMKEEVLQKRIGFYLARKTTYFIFKFRHKLSKKYSTRNTRVLDEKGYMGRTFNLSITKEFLMCIASSMIGSWIHLKNKNLYDEKPPAS